MCYFHNIASIRKRANRITKILHQGLLITNLKLIKKEIERHFGKLYEHKGVHRPKALNRDIMRLKMESTEYHERKFTKQEI
ncbi:hypothetical protein POUND7_006364 [Theobroma cacao]